MDDIQHDYNQNLSDLDISHIEGSVDIGSQWKVEGEVATQQQWCFIEDKNPLHSSTLDGPGVKDPRGVDHEHYEGHLSLRTGVAVKEERQPDEQQSSEQEERVEHHSIPVGILPREFNPCI